ncbi:MAG: MoaD/ThiS family protein [Candidatus Eisenbacteria bacterium]
MTTTAPSVEVRLPQVLKMAVGTDRIAARGSTIPEALRSAFVQVPGLEKHLLLDSGELRPHVLCVVNGEALLRAQVAGFVLHDGDEILIHQAISGG